jgi:hypothetical protein
MKINPDQFELIKTRIIERANQVQIKDSISIAVAAKDDENYDIINLKFGGSGIEYDNVFNFCEACLEGCVFTSERRPSFSLLKSDTGVVLMDYEAGEYDADIYFDKIENEDEFWKKFKYKYREYRELLFRIDGWKSNCPFATPVEQLEKYIDIEINKNGWTKIYEYIDSDYDEDIVLFAIKKDKDSFETFYLTKPKHEINKSNNTLFIFSNWTDFLESLYTLDEKLSRYKSGIRTVDKEELDSIINELEESYKQGRAGFDNFISSQQ